MYGYQVVLECPTNRQQRAVLQILSWEHHATAIRLLRAENLYGQYRDWNLVEFRTVRLQEPCPGTEPSRPEAAGALPATRAIDLVA